MTLPHAIRVARNIVLLPWIVYRTVLVVVRMHRNGPMRGINESVLDAQVLIPTAEEDEESIHNEISKAATQLAAQQGWMELADAIAEAEAERRASFGPTRDYGLMSWGARAQLTALLNIAHPSQFEKQIATFIGRIEDAAEKAPDNHILAVLAARSHMDVGWSWRGDGFADEVSRSEWETMGSHYQKAGDFLAPFVEGGPKHPSVCHAAHILARQLGDDGREMRKIYETWRELDPGNPMLYGEHGFHLLPRWFGDYEELEREARRAAGATAGSNIGTAPYFWMLSSLMQCETEALVMVDQGLLLESLSDVIAQWPTQAVPNAIFREFSEVYLAHSLSDDREARMSPVREMAGTVCRHIAENHLSAINPDVWEGETNGAKGVLASLYRADVDAGRILDFDGGRLRIHDLAA